MRKIKSQPKLLPADVTVQELRTQLGVNYVVLRELGRASFAAYGKDKQPVSEIENIIRKYAKKNDFLLIEGPKGIGKHEMMGKPFFQFSLKIRPQKRSSQPVVNQAVVEKPSVVTGTPVVPGQKPGRRGFLQKNRLGWSKDGYDTFVAMTKPGSNWSNIKKNYRDPNLYESVEADCHDFWSLFSSHAEYAPLSSMFSQLGGLMRQAHFNREAWVQKYGSLGNYGGDDKSVYFNQIKQLINRIQPRLERLWNFARTEALAKSIVVKSMASSRKMI